MSFRKTLAIVAFSSLLATGAALAQGTTAGTPNAAGGAKGQDAPSSATPPRTMKRHRHMRHRTKHHAMKHHAKPMMKKQTDAPASSDAPTSDDMKK